jgi:hypothetical protein
MKTWGAEMNKKFLIPLILTTVLATAMTAAAEVAGDPEIIFPEIAALAVGYLYAPKRSWQVNSTRLFILISGCAVIGLLISMYMPGPLYLKVLVSFLIAQLIYLYSGTTLAPLNSAIVLPVLIGTRSVSYLISAAVMTLSVIVCRALLEKTGIREKEKFIVQPRPDREAFLRMLLRICVTAVLAVPAIFAGLRFIIAPPLLVAFTELVDHWRPGTAKKPHRVILLLTACAAVGDLSRYLITVRLHLPMAAATAAAILIVLLILKATGLFMPPAGAMAILAMLIPEEAMARYVPAVAVGSTVFMLTAVAWNVTHHTGTENCA